MSIKLPSSLMMVSGVVVGPSQVAVQWVQGAGQATGTGWIGTGDDQQRPGAASGGNHSDDGRFTLTIKDGPTIKQRLTLGYALRVQKRRR